MIQEFSTERNHQPRRSGLSWIAGILLLDVTPLVLETAGCVTTKLIEQRNGHDFALVVFPLDVASRIVPRWEQIHHFERERNTVVYTKIKGQTFFLLRSEVPFVSWPRLCRDCCLTACPIDFFVSPSRKVLHLARSQ